MFAIPERYFANLSGAYRLLIFILVVALSATLIAFLAGGLKTGIPVGILVVAILWITGPLWKPSSHEGNLKVRLTSLTVVSGVALAVAGKTPEAKPLLGRFFEHLLHLPPAAAQQVAASDRLISGFVLAFTLLGVFVVNWFTRDKSAMHKHPRPLDQDFPEQTYQQQMKRYSEILMSRLITLDDETRWDDYFFAPLEAEVEVTSGRRSIKKIVDLMRALKGDRTSRIILVLGDPGAGKSIALRKLAKELMKEVDRTGRLPVYVNLKEWGDEHQWTEESPPTAQELRSFILRTLKSYSVFADQFLEEYFDRMLDRGRFFFLLDSFDEIPAVLDVNEGSWLIQHLSRMITEFFVSQDEGRGIVASRFYRRPKFGRVESATFEIRPFSDMRIHEALLRSEKLRGDTIDKLFRERTELIPVARNPFSAALIRIYAENHGGELPSSQLEMYESYIRGRLDASTDEMRRHELTIDQMITNATEIAWGMFRETEIGLEAPIHKLAMLLPNIRIETVTTVLRYSGLARMSAGTDPRFSFVHRRLNEYFVARGLLDNPASVTLQAIPTDSRYRDALALYCEVGELEHVKNIAAFCWSEISNVIPDSATPAVERLRAVHCLRFLRDAFRARPEAMAFVVELAEYINERLQPAGDLLAAKIALEATGLLPEGEAEPILVKALQMGNDWISETALHSCRHLKKVGPKLDRGLFAYLRSIPIREFLHRNREIVFSLSLSDAFRSLRRYCVFRSIDNRIFVAIIIFCCVLSPVVGIGSVLTFVTASAIIKSAEGNRFFSRLSRSSRDFQNLVRFELALGFAVLSLNVWGEGDLIEASPSGLGNLLAPGLRFAFGLHRSYVAAVFLLIGLALVPVVDLSFLFLRIPWRDLLSLKTLKMIPATAVLIAGGIGLVKVVEPIGPWVNVHGLVLVIALLFLVGVPILFLTLRFWRNCYIDRRLLRQAIRSTAITRKSIAIDFLRFKTRRSRIRYVEWLRDAQIQPVGDWIGSRPNVGSDAASTMLAQLDERWLAIEA